MSRKTDRRKKSLYLPDRLIDEVGRESKRLDRSFSWLIQRAWAIAKDEITALPDVPTLPERERVSGVALGSSSLDAEIAEYIR